jgi:DNA-binding FadR family transcriptional regulator
MNPSIEPLRVSSLKDACVARLEELILSGELQAGERLPAERDFALKLGVSRPVLHEALVDLASKGLVTIQPRRGVVVNDFRQSGSFAILSSLLNYANGDLDPAFQHSLLAVRILIERETARLAATNASVEQLIELRQILAEEKAAPPGDPALLTELDYNLHLKISMASGNLVYPLILNSFRKVYTHFTAAFFQMCASPAVLAEVQGYHATLIEALEGHDAEQSAATMEEMLVRGEKQLLECLSREGK